MMEESRRRITNNHNYSGVRSDSDTEIIDDSVIEESFTVNKKSLAKNQTVFVAESEESVSEDDGDEEINKLPNPVARRSIGQQPNIVLSSDDDAASKRGSIRKQSDSSPTKVVLSSSEGDEMSPEMVPKKRAPAQTPRLSNSLIGRKTKKRLMVLDSDSDNSFVIEQQRRGKLTCMKDTPPRIVTNKVKPNVVTNMSFQDEEEDGDDDGTDNNSASEEESSEEDESGSEDKSDNEKDHNNKSRSSTRKDFSYEKGIGNENDSENKNDNSIQKNISDNDSKAADTSSGKSTPDINEQVIQSNYDDDDDGPDEDQMVMSRATRMSIMGFLPKENDSDDSDYIQSDDTRRTSRGSSTNSITETENSTEVPTKEQTPDKNGDSSRLTCSPFASPLQDITNEINNSIRKSLHLNSDDRKDDKIPIQGLKLKRVSELMTPKNQVIDDDVTIIDTPPEIIALSSDDEEVVTVEKKSPSIKKGNVKSEPESTLPNTIKTYLLPPSYPNQVVYVKKHVRENEVSKLNGLREELQNIRYLLEHMEMETLPDGGARLIERLTTLEDEVRRQGDKVAAMLVEPDAPTPDDIAKDGFSKEPKEPTWEEIQKASNAVQPRMFGKQAMATHLAERNLIVERLGDLHKSLGTRPPESELAKPPRAMKTEMMPHQLHALAWLKWRETQRPPGGILADDMGLGKTITMISLIAHDKETGIGDDDDDDDDYRSRVVRGGTLVVCPASLMQQWAGEVGAHCSPHSLSLTLHHGATRAQHAHRLAANDLVLTTYNILQRENEKKGVLTKVTWRRVILDEAHVVRNHKSATSGAVSAIKAKRRWALTGTPLHNKDLDLFALLKFLRCTPFDDLTMWKKWIDNKSVGGEQRLNMIMRCLMLRRTKALLQSSGQLACLPERTVHDCPVKLSSEEMNVYQKVLVSSKTLFAQYLQQRGQAGNGGELSRAEKDNVYALHKRMVALKGVKPVKSHEILVLLLRLRQMCCHCGLISAMLSEDSAQVEEDPGGQELLAELDKLSLDDSRSKKRSSRGSDSEPEAEGGTVAEALRSALSLGNPVFRLERPSAKIAAVMACLNTEVFPNKGEKAVIVSQWTSVLSLVEKELRAARVKCVTLSGSVAVTARPALVQQLNDQKSEVRVMLLSLCAGGVGLNLCGANHLLLLDPHWNPQLEQQAQDRVYRVGQQRAVHVYKFMCVDTVEQSIRKLQEAKLEMADNILTGARNTNASKLTIDDLKMLFNMGPADS